MRPTAIAIPLVPDGSEAAVQCREPEPAAPVASIFGMGFAREGYAVDVTGCDLVQIVDLEERKDLQEDLDEAEAEAEHRLGTFDDVQQNSPDYARACQVVHCTAEGESALARGRDWMLTNVSC